MIEDYRKSHLGKDKALSYDRQFRGNPYRSMMWDIELACLKDIVGRLPAGKPSALLDFACGSGRVINALSKYAEKSTGIDVSADMLAIAKETCPDCELKKMDLTIEEFEDNRQFDLITSFRFFPNAQPGLRADALKALVNVMTPNGTLVFNNHKNSGSLIYLLSRLPGIRTRQGMSSSEVSELLARENLYVEKSYGIGKVPSIDNFRLLPTALLAPLERMLTKLDILRGLSSNIIYVCKKNSAG